MCIRDRGMSVQPLRPPVVAGWIAVARESIAAVDSVPTGTLDEVELADTVSSLTALESQVAAVKLRVLAEADRRRLRPARAASPPRPATPGPSATTPYRRARPH